jgi:hypothetical protein
VAVLLDVGAMAVTVLEVDAEVLDWLPAQLGGHESVHPIGQVIGKPDYLDQVG